MSTRYEVRDFVAHITLDRADALNAIDPTMLDRLRADVARAVDDQDVRVIAVRGAGGRAFSAGVDLGYFSEHDVFADAGANLRFTAGIRDVFRELETAPLLTVAIIDGFALAGGLELALCCDFILCSDESAIGDQHARYDLMPGAGASQRLPRRIGVQQAKYLLFTGRRIGGQEAVRIGLALASCPADALDDEVEAFLEQFRGRSRVGLAHMKRAIDRGLDLALPDALELERLVSQEYFSCYPDARLGLAAFENRRR